MKLSGILFLGLLGTTATASKGCQHGKVTFKSKLVPNGEKPNLDDTIRTQDQWESWVAANSDNCGGFCNEPTAYKVEGSGNYWQMECFAARVKKGVWPALSGPGVWGAKGDDYQMRCSVHCDTRRGKPYQPERNCAFTFGSC